MGCIKENGCNWGRCISQTQLACDLKKFTWLDALQMSKSNANLNLLGDQNNDLRTSGQHIRFLFNNISVTQMEIPPIPTLLGVNLVDGEVPLHTEAFFQKKFFSNLVGSSVKEEKVNKKKTDIKWKWLEEIWEKEIEHVFRNRNYLFI